jgi:hypothetical protein
MYNLDNRQNQLTNQQQQLIEIQKEIHKQSSKQQDQLAEILKKLSEK